MISKKWFVIILVLIIAIISGACSDNQTADSEEETGQRPEYGSALIQYKFVTNSPPKLSIVIQPDIEVIIQRDPSNDVKLIVSGFSPATAFFQIEAKNAGESCFVQCDIPVIYYAEGTLTQTLEDGKPRCKMPMTFTAALGEGETKAYGDCPESVSNKSTCNAYLMLAKDPNTYTFTKEFRELSMPAGKGVTLEAKIINVQLPSAVGCEW